MKKGPDRNPKTKLGTKARILKVPLVQPTSLAGSDWEKVKSTSLCGFYYFRRLSNPKETSLTNPVTGKSFKNTLGLDLTKWSVEMGGQRGQKCEYFFKNIATDKIQYEHPRGFPSAPDFDPR